MVKWQVPPFLKSKLLAECHQKTPDPPGPPPPSQFETQHSLKTVDRYSSQFEMPYIQSSVPQAMQSWHSVSFPMRFKHALRISSSWVKNMQNSKTYRITSNLLKSTTLTLTIDLAKSAQRTGRTSSNESPRKSWNICSEQNSKTWQDILQDHTKGSNILIHTIIPLNLTSLGTEKNSKEYQSKADTVSCLPDRCSFHIFCDCLMSLTPRHQRHQHWQRLRGM